MALNDTCGWNTTPRQGQEYSLRLAQSRYEDLVSMRREQREDIGPVFVHARHDHDILSHPGAHNPRVREGGVLHDPSGAARTRPPMF